MGAIRWNLHDPARIDVRASRAAGEPRRTPARAQVRHRSGAWSKGSTLLFLHDLGDGAQEAWSRGPNVLDVLPVDRKVTPAEPSSWCDHRLAASDADLASLRAAFLDLDAVLAAWPGASDERVALVASGTAAAAALIALGAGLSTSAGHGDTLRHELLLDLREGDTLHDRIVERVTERIAAAVLIDPAGEDGDWRDIAFARVTTPLALLERRGGPTARRAFAVGGGDRLRAETISEASATDLAAALAARPAADVFADVAARPDAFGVDEVRQAHGCLVDVWPAEICRSDVARDLARTVWRTILQPRAWAR